MNQNTQKLVSVFNQDELAEIMTKVNPESGQSFFMYANFLKLKNKVLFFFELRVFVFEFINSTGSIY